MKIQKFSRAARAEMLAQRVTGDTLNAIQNTLTGYYAPLLLQFSESAKLLPQLSPGGRASDVLALDVCAAVTRTWSTWPRARSGSIKTAANRHR